MKKVVTAMAAALVAVGCGGADEGTTDDVDAPIPDTVGVAATTPNGNCSITAYVPYRNGSNNQYYARGTWSCAGNSSTKWQWYIELRSGGGDVLASVSWDNNPTGGANYIMGNSSGTKTAPGNSVFKSVNCSTYNSVHTVWHINKDGSPSQSADDKSPGRACGT